MVVIKEITNFDKKRTLCTKASKSLGAAKESRYKIGLIEADFVYLVDPTEFEKWGAIAIVKFTHEEMQQHFLWLD